MKILIVEDDPEIRNPLLDFLREEGYPVQGVSNGAAALRVLAQESGWIVFLDWMMPGMDGRAVVQVLQASPEMRQANSFILMSATAGWRWEEIPAAAGIFSGYLSKPFELDDVLALVQRLGSGASSAEGSL